MNAIARVQTTAGPRAGGKIVRRRRKAAENTPFARPPPPPLPSTESPDNNNWFTGLIFPARIIASSAAKIFSFMSDTSSSFSSSSSSSSSSDSEDGVGSDDGGYDIPSDGIGESIENYGTSSEMVKCLGKEPQLPLWKSESKRVIEQLLIQETYSREECHRLMGIIQSRVVDCSTIEEGITSRQNQMHYRGSGNDTPDLCTKALMEAKTWLEEKKLGSSPKSDMEHICAYNLTKHEVGSPVDMAKSYMHARPPWSSPSLRLAGSRTSSPMLIEHFRQETPYSVGGYSPLARQKRDPLASGSWNIQEEIRRVRSKATTDMLHTLPSTRIDLSSFVLEPKASKNYLVDHNIVGGITDGTHVPDSLEVMKPLDASVNLTAEFSSFHGLPGPSSLKMTQYASPNEALSTNPPIVAQLKQSIQIVEEGGTLDSSSPVTVELLSKQQDANDARSGVRNGFKEQNFKLSGAADVNCSLSSRFSLSAGFDGEQNPKQSDEEKVDPANSIHDKLTSSNPLEETCVLLSDASVDVPILNAIDGIASGSQIISSVYLQESTQVNLEESVAGIPGSTEMQQGKQPSSRYQRKGRGKGK